MMTAPWIDNLYALEAALGITGAGVLSLGWKFMLKPSIAFFRGVSATNLKLAAFDPAQLHACSKQIADVKGETAQIRALLGPNGGSSLYDKVTTAGKAAVMSQARLSTMFDIVVDRPMFETNALGDITSVNAAFERAFDTSCEDMRGRGWINVVIPQDRDPFVRAWHHAISDERPFRSTARCVTQRPGALRSGLCSWSMQPILEPGTDTVLAWMGAVDPPPEFFPAPVAAAGSTSVDQPS